MLKTVSSITNAIGALNFKGTWDANANSPALASSVGTKGDYYVVGTAGATNLNGISNWGVGDLATFNGSVWQRVEGGADLNGVNLSVSGTSTLSGLTASTALALNASKEIVSVTNTGTGNNVLATTPTLVGDVTLSTGNLVVSSGKGIDFSLTPGTGTSELLADYEEGNWTPIVVGSSSAGTGTYSVQVGTYTKVGDLVHVQMFLIWTAHTGTGDMKVGGLPFTTSATFLNFSAATIGQFENIALTISSTPMAIIATNGTTIDLRQMPTGGGVMANVPMDTAGGIILAAAYKV
jgi:hypothetical protein